MCSELRAGLTAALLLLLGGGAGAAAGQSVLERSAGLTGGWTGRAGQGHFHFLHRFQSSPPPARKVSSSPTFLLSYSVSERLLLGTHYATASDVVTDYPNEWEAFARWALLAGVSVQGGYNLAAESLDAAVDARHAVGPLRVLATARGFTAAFGGAAAVALGAGAVWSVGALALAADYTSTIADDTEGAWSAALQLRIPSSPHTLSLHATNANTGTLQGSSRGSGTRRYGFEFTIPITVARYLGGGAASDAVAAAGDTVTIVIEGLKYRPEVVEVRPGTRVRWVNRDPLEHTATAAGSWDSGLIAANGGAWARVFATNGEYDYSCTPHPFMKGRVIVNGGGGP